MIPTIRASAAMRTLLSEMAKQDAKIIVSSIRTAGTESAGVVVLMDDLHPDAAEAIASRLADYLAVVDPNTVQFPDSVATAANNLVQNLTNHRLPGAVFLCNPSTTDESVQPKYVVFCVGGQANEIDAMAAGFERMLNARKR